MFVVVVVVGWIVVSFLSVGHESDQKCETLTSARHINHINKETGGGAPRMPPPSAEAVLSCHKNKDEGVARASSARTDRRTWGGAVSLMWVCVCWNIVCNKVCEWKTTGSRLHFSYCGKMFLMDLNGVRFVWFGFNYESNIFKKLLLCWSLV